MSLGPQRSSLNTPDNRAPEKGACEGIPPQDSCWWGGSKPGAVEGRPECPPPWTSREATDSEDASGPITLRWNSPQREQAL